MSIIKYSENGFSGHIEHLPIGPTIVEIECIGKSCKQENAIAMFNDVCKYLERFADGREVLTNNVVSEIKTESDDDATYIKKVLLQVVIN